MYVMYLVGRELGIREELNMCAGHLAEVREAAREILVTDIQVSVTRCSLIMIDKARCAKHVSNNSLIKFATKTIRNEKVPQK